MEKFIDITGCDLRELIRAAYDLSKPVGLGFFHFQEGPIPEGVMDLLMEQDSGMSVVLNMDYVLGRQVKMTVWRGMEDDGYREDWLPGRLYIRDEWFDHTPAHLDALLDRIGVKRPGA